jgi:hypothetical protein
MRRLAGAATLAALTISCAGACSGGADSTGPSGPPNSSPVGSFSLSKVDGEDLPMKWDEIHISGSTYIRTYFVSGKATFKSDSTFSYTVKGKIVTGVSPDQNLVYTAFGTWRLLSGGRLELSTSTGGSATWLTTDQIYTLTATARYPNLNGGESESTMIWVRD